MTSHKPRSDSGTVFRPRHRRKRSQREAKPKWLGKCPACGKLSFSTRAAAKAYIKHVGDDGLRTYRCQDMPDLWHMGHLLRDVVRGEVGREVYRPFDPEEIEEARREES